MMRSLSSMMADAYLLEDLDIEQNFKKTKVEIQDVFEILALLSLLTVTVVAEGTFQ